MSLNVGDVVIVIDEFQDDAHSSLKPWPVEIGDIGTVERYVTEPGWDYAVGFEESGTSLTFVEKELAKFCQTHEQPMMYSKSDGWFCPWCSK